MPDVHHYPELGRLLPDGRLRIPTAGVFPGGERWDGAEHVGPEHPNYRAWLEIITRQPEHPAEPADPREAIRRVSRQLLAAVDAGDADGVLALWAGDGVLMPPHRPPVCGREALGAYFRELFARAELTFAFTASAVEVFGAGAVERLTYEVRMTPRGGGSTVEDDGTGLHVYRRGADGAWLLAQDIWHSDRPAGAPTS